MSRSEQGAMELYKYLYACASYPHIKFSPSIRVDQCWHALLLFPFLYQGVCSLLPLPKGQLVPHNPVLSHDSESEKRERYRRAMGTISFIFRTPLDTFFWPEERAGGPLKRAREEEEEGLGKVGATPAEAAALSMLIAPPFSGQSITSSPIPLSSFSATKQTWEKIPLAAGGPSGEGSGSGGSASATASATASSAAAPTAAAAASPDASSTKIRLLVKFEHREIVHINVRPWTRFAKISAAVVNSFGFPPWSSRMYYLGFT